MVRFQQVVLSHYGHLNNSQQPHTISDTVVETTSSGYKFIVVQNVDENEM